MEKNGVLAAKNQIPMKKKEKKWLKNVLGYLKADSYLFAPLISHSTNSAGAPGVAIAKPIEEDNGRLLEKVGKYLKSDNYMYAPFIVTQQKHAPAAKAIKSPQTGYIKSIRTEISTRKITKKSNRPTEQPAKRQTRRHRMVVKHMGPPELSISLVRKPLSSKP